MPLCLWWKIILCKSSTCERMRWFQHSLICHIVHTESSETAVITDIGYFRMLGLTIKLWQMLHVSCYTNCRINGSIHYIQFNTASLPILHSLYLYNLAEQYWRPKSQDWLIIHCLWFLPFCLKKSMAHTDSITTPHMAGPLFFLS